MPDSQSAVEQVPGVEAQESVNRLSRRSIAQLDLEQLEPMIERIDNRLQDTAAKLARLDVETEKGISDGNPYVFQDMQDRLTPLQRRLETDQDQRKRLNNAAEEVLTGAIGAGHSPVTVWGQAVSGLLIITGLLLVGVFTAVLTSLFVGEEAEEMQEFQEQLNQQLANVEAKVDRLIADRTEHH